jgi:hypothetical protein
MIIRDDDVLAASTIVIWLGITYGKKLSAKPIKDSMEMPAVAIRGTKHIALR